MMAWSAKYGDYENGDPELHHVAGTLYGEGTVRQLLLYQDYY